MADIDNQDDSVEVQYAYVKYARYTLDFEVVNIKKVKIQDDPLDKSTRRPFEPQNSSDFDKNMWYCVRTKKGTVTRKEENFWALIAILHASKEELEKIVNSTGRGSRITFPSIPEPESDPESTDESEGESSQNRKSGTAKAKESRLQGERSKRKHEEVDLDKYMENTSLTKDAPEENGALTEEDQHSPKRKKKKNKKSKRDNQDSDRNASFSSEATSLDSMQGSINSLINIMNGFVQDVKDLKEQVQTCTSKFNSVDIILNDLSSKMSKCENKAVYIQSWLNDVSQEPSN